MGKSVLVVGGGLAGLSAACDLVEAGWEVTLLERKPFAGGRVYSFRDPETGIEMDNGQHLFLGACREFISFLRRIGAWDAAALQDRMRIRFFEKTGREYYLEESGLPAPLHLAPSILRMPALTRRERWGILRAAWEMKKAGAAEAEGETFRAWLERNGQGPEAMRRFWDLVTVSALNERPEHVSAAAGIFVFQEGFWRARDGLRIGYMKRGQSVIADRAVEWLRSRGAQVLLGKPALALEPRGDRIDGVRTESGILRADAYVAAIPHTVLPRLLATAHPFLAELDRLPTSPIVNVHIVYDRAVTDIDFTAVVDSPAQWVFNKTAMWKEAKLPGTYLCLSISGAGPYLDLRKEELETRFVREMEEVFPGAKSARRIAVRVIREPSATFTWAPGVRRLRRPQRTPWTNFFVAGDWTDTGWPSTMEGAVRSGRAAALALLS